MSDPIVVRKKPVEVQAMRYLGAPSGEAICLWSAQGGSPAALDPERGGILISTLEGIMTCSLGDWVIRGVAGEFYPCKDDIFRATYDVPEGS